MTRILYRHSDWIPNKAATKHSKNNIYIKIISGDGTDLCYAEDEIGYQTQSYKEDADHEERRSRPEGQRLNRAKGAKYPDKPTNRGKATEMNRENMSGPTGPGPPRRQRNTGNTNPMACKDCRDTDFDQ